MSHKLFVGTTNGLALKVDEQVLAQLRRERADRLAWLHWHAGSTNKKRKRGYDRLTKTAEQRITEIMNLLVKKNDCWEWQGVKTTKGYGFITWVGHNVGLHRFIWFLTNGQWPMDCVCHRCDNPPCCNPDHLFAGTHSDNRRDMINKGRQNWHCGEKTPTSKLITEQVIEIRKTYKRFGHPNTYDLARKFGVGATTVREVVLGRSWKHL